MYFIASSFLGMVRYYKKRRSRNRQLRAGADVRAHRGRAASCSEAEAAYPGLIPAQMVGQLVAHGPLDLPPEQRGIVAEVALQRVLVDDDAVRVDVAGHGA